MTSAQMVKFLDGQLKEAFAEIARLTAGREVYRDCLWREIMGGNNCLNQAFICDNPKGADCECQQKFDRIAKHAEGAALETKL